MLRIWHQPTAGSPQMAHFFSRSEAQPGNNTLANPANSKRFSSSIVVDIIFLQRLPQERSSQRSAIRRPGHRQNFGNACNRRFALPAGPHLRTTTRMPGCRARRSPRSSARLPWRRCGRPFGTSPIGLPIAARYPKRRRVNLSRSGSRAGNTSLDVVAVGVVIRKSSVL